MYQQAIVAAGDLMEVVVRLVAVESRFALELAQLTTSI